jgi:5-(carboxyamino)imidazole ribonucleotide synthase
MTSRVLGPGSTLGMLGGGQLGRMFALAAREKGYRVVVFGDPADSPAGQVSDCSIPAAFHDQDALLQFARQVDVVSYEQENIPVPTVEFLLQHVPVYPGPELLRASQHRLLEKTTLRSIGIPTADFVGIQSAAELSEAVSVFGGEAILKTVTLGYDGKGQARVRSADDPVAVWQRFAVAEAILERIVDFDFELSIVASRFMDGTCAFYSPVRNDHANHILDLSVSPVDEISGALCAEAVEIARAILEHFDVIGVLCVELFVTKSGTLVVNEIAPRPHNSGHLTIDACSSSQFEQQFRAICGLASGDVEMQAPAAMANLLGDHLLHVTAERWRLVFEMPRVHVHMYGKSEARIGRKMGHITAIAGTAAESARVALAARRLLGEG